MSRKPIFREGYPKIVVDQTIEGDDGSFLSRGKVLFILETGGALEFPFENARSRDAAMLQAVEALEAHVTRFDRAAKQIREGLA